jgi:hypothetical protein
MMTIMMIIVDGDIDNIKNNGDSDDGDEGKEKEKGRRINRWG